VHRREAWVTTLAFVGLLLGVTLSGVILAQGSLTHLPIILGPGVASTPTEPIPPGSDLLVTGVVFVTMSDPHQYIQGASVSIVSCVGGRRFGAMSDVNGQFSLILPGLYLDPCSSVTIEVWADGYQPYFDTVPAADLRVQPKIDISLMPGATPTPTTPSGDVIVSGKVYLADSAPQEPIVGAVVSAESCLDGRRFADTSDSQGAYSFLIPGEHVSACDETGINVRATGYRIAQRSVTRQELLRGSPQNFELQLENDPGGDTFRVTGLVYDALAGPDLPVSGASVSVMT